ncbi:MAG: MFS transporter [Cyanobacteria bacterium P01_G01_bin.54]
MRTFVQIWLGQLVSAIGSSMTFFALTLWIWEQTGSVSTLVLIGLCFRLPQIPMNLVAGVIVDRFNRKYLMLLGDAIMALTTLVIGVLQLIGQLQIWHLALVALSIGSFGPIQGLAYRASLSLIVPKKQYTRASSMGSMVGYGSSIVSPALAGLFYPLLGLPGIIGIDFATFAFAFITLLTATIPQPPQKTEDVAATTPQSNPWRQNLTFGFHHIWQQPSLKMLFIVGVLLTFAHDLGATLYQPMVLARTDGSAQALGAVSAAAGMGGVTGGMIITLWGGPKRRLRGLLGGYIGAGLSKMVFGWGQSPVVWVPAQLCSSLTFPMSNSCRSALWMEAIAPEHQGRVFAANSTVTQGVSAIAVLIAGPLADRVLEPAMQPGGVLVGLFGTAFGSGPGAGMAILYTACALALLLIGVGSFLLHQLRTLETHE